MPLTALQILINATRTAAYVHLKEKCATLSLLFPLATPIDQREWRELVALLRV